MTSFSLDQDPIKELSNFVAVAFEVFLSAVEGLIVAKASTDVALEMANARVEKYIVRDMIPTMLEDPGFTDQDTLRVLATYALYTDKGFEICVLGSRANVTFVQGTEPAEGGKSFDPVVGELSRRKKELGSKLGEHEKEKIHPKLSEAAVETLLSEEGVPKWMEKLGAALVWLFKDPKVPEGMKPIQFLSNEVRATMWDTKESYANKYHVKSKERKEHGGRSSQSQGSRARKKHTLSVEQMLERGGRKYRKKSKRSIFGLWSMRGTSST